MSQRLRALFTLVKDRKYGSQHHHFTSVQTYLYRQFQGIGCLVLDFTAARHVCGTQTFTHASIHAHK